VVVCRELDIIKYDQSINLKKLYLPSESIKINKILFEIYEKNNFKTII